MKKLSYVLLLLSITAFCFGSSNSKNENKLFGMTKSEITSNIVRLSENNPGDLISSTTVFGESVIGYMAVSEGPVWYQFSVYAETEDPNRISGALLEVWINSWNPGESCIGYNYRSDGHLVWVETMSYYSNNFTGIHRVTVNGTPYECQTTI